MQASADEWEKVPQGYIHYEGLADHIAGYSSGLTDLTSPSGLSALSFNEGVTFPTGIDASGSDGSGNTWTYHEGVAQVVSALVEGQTYELSFEQSVTGQEQCGVLDDTNVPDGTSYAVVGGGFAYCATAPASKLSLIALLFVLGLFSSRK